METKKTIEKIKHNKHNIMAKTQHEIDDKMGAIEQKHEHHHKNHHGGHHKHHDHHDHK